MSHADVLIIGAGPAGGVAARQFQDAGLNVVALEQGEWQDRTQYRGAEWDWDLSQGKTWASRLDVRQGPSDYPIDLSESDMGILNFSGVGGGTILYNAIWIRLLEATFRSKTAYGIGDDWPISYADLQSFYERTDRDVGVCGLGGNPAYPPGEDPPLPVMPFNEGAMRVARAMHARGLHWWPDSNAIISTSYDGRHQCVRRGTCGQGCNEGAKSSFDLTHWKKFTAAGGTLETGAWVRKIHTDANGLALGAEYVDRNGAVMFQSADIVLVCANGVGTPRLLLNSANERAPDGLANSSGLLGRRLMLHPLAVLFGYFEEQLGAWQGHNGSTIQTLQFAHDDPARGHRGGSKMALHPSGSGPMGEAIKVMMAGTAPDQFHAAFERRFGHGLMWSIMCEDFPDENNRVVLSPTLFDKAGMPAPKLIYKTSKDSQAALDYAVEQARTIFTEAGATDLLAFNPAGANAHMTGTARMGDDPAASVVDRWCMSHDIPNLGILDGSVFVTCGAVNPTSTIAALSLRATERLIERRGAMAKPDRNGKTIFDLGPPPPQPATVPPVDPLSDAERERLFALADALIPAVDFIPAAGEVIRHGLLDRALSVRADLVPAIRAALALPIDAAGELLAIDPALWQAVVTAIAGSYYLDDRVKARIGYHGQLPNPATPDRYPLYVEEGLLDHLLDGEWQESWKPKGLKQTV